MSKKEKVTNQTTQVTVVMPDVFQNVDFNTLNNSITALATYNGTLSDKDKEFAVETISTWERSVVTKLNVKKEEAQGLLYSLDASNPSISSCFPEEDFEALIAATKTDALYQIYLDKIEQLKYLKSTSPETPMVDLTTTLEQQLIDRRDYQFECQKNCIAINKAEREAANAMKALKVEMNKNDDIKELITRVKKYQRNVSKFKNECAEKSQLAKISVTISSMEIRQALKELLNFSVTI